MSGFEVNLNPERRTKKETQVSVQHATRKPQKSFNKTAPASSYKQKELTGTLLHLAFPQTVTDGTKKKPQNKTGHGYAQEARNEGGGKSRRLAVS